MRVALRERTVLPFPMCSLCCRASGDLLLSPDCALGALSATAGMNWVWFLFSGLSHFFQGNLEPQEGTKLCAFCDTHDNYTPWKLERLLLWCCHLDWAIEKTVFAEHSCGVDM